MSAARRSRFWPPTCGTSRQAPPYSTPATPPAIPTVEMTDRTYVEATSLWLDPGETKRVALMFELAPDNLDNKVYDAETLPEVRKILRVPNHVGVVARIEDPTDSPRHKIDVLGGAEAQIVTGRSTRFDRFVAERSAVRGRIVTVEGSQSVPGKAIVRTRRNRYRVPTRTPIRP